WRRELVTALLLVLGETVFCEGVFPTPNPRPIPRPEPKPRQPLASHWLTTAASSAFERVNSTYERRASAGGVGPIGSCFLSSLLLAGRRPGFSIPVKYPQIFPLASSSQRKSNPTRQNSLLISSASLKEISGRL